MSGRFCDVVEDSTPPDFECVVLDADLPIFQVKKLEGVLAYVRVLSGKLPALMRNVLVDTWGNLLGRPEKGAFMPSAANLVIPAGRSYPVTLLASLPPLATLRPYLRNALLPAHDLDPAALPVALGGLPQDFRAVAGRLVSAPRSTPVEVDPMALWEAGQKAQEAGLHRAIALGDVVANNKPSLAVEHILTALTDEIEDVRFAAAYRLRSVLDEV